MEDVLAAKLDERIQSVTHSNFDHMEEKSLLEMVAALVVGALGAVGFPKLWGAWFGHLTKKVEANTGHEEEIRELKTRITRIVTSVDLLLIVIKHEFEGKESIINAIDKVESHLHEVKPKEE